MDDREMLLARLGAVGGDLARASTATAHPVLEELGGRSAAIATRFRAQLTSLSAEVDRLTERIRINDGGGRPGWLGYSDLSRRARTTTAESLEFLEGVLARRAELDHGVAAVTDRLIDGLAAGTNLDGNRITIFGAGHFTTRSADIVRLQYPRFDVWTIPIVAHEFGHHVVEELRDVHGARDEADREKRPVETLVEQASGGELSKRHVREIFCDIFGVYALGSAFTMTLLLDWLDPVTADRSRESHPPGAWRAWLVVQALRRSATGGDPIAPIADLAEERWNDTLDAVGVASQPAPGMRNRLCLVLDEAWKILDANANGVYFDQMTAAQQARGALALRVRDDTSPPPSSTAFGMRAVLNGAWLARVNQLGDSEKISEAALELARVQHAV